MLLIRLAGVLAVSLLLASECAPAQHARPAAQAEPVSFRNGTVTLSGTLYLPAGAGPHAALLAFHAASGDTRDFHAYRHLATELPAAGFAILLFDRRGSGASSGDFNTASFADLAADGIAGIELLKARRDVDPTRIGVWGVSQGGWLATLAASLSRDVAFVVSVSGPSVSPARQMDHAATSALRAAGRSPDVIDRALRVRATMNDYYRGRATRSDAEKAVASIRHEPWFREAFLPNSGNPPAEPKRSKWYVEMDYDPLDALARVTLPMVFFFSETDPWVPVDESIARIRHATRSNPAVTIRRIAQADHLMETGAPDSGGPISERYTTQLLEWLRAMTRNR